MHASGIRELGATHRIDATTIGCIEGTQYQISVGRISGLAPEDRFVAISTSGLLGINISEENVLGLLGNDISLCTSHLIEHDAIGGIGHIITLDVSTSYSMLSISTALHRYDTGNGAQV